MALPANVSTVTFSGALETPQGTPAMGLVSVEMAPPYLLDADLNVALVRKPTTVALDAQGAFTMELVCTDDPQLNPTGWTYRVTIKLTHEQAPIQFSMAAPASPSGLQLASVAPVATSLGTAVVKGDKGDTGDDGVSPPSFQLLAAGEANCDRRTIVLSGIPLLADSSCLVYFTAERSETITTMTGYCAGTAATGVTRAQYVAYSVAANGDLTLVGSTPNDTAMFAATHTVYTRTLSTPWAKVKGQRYAVGVLIAATVLPTVYSMFANSASINGTEWALAPRITGTFAGQAGGPSATVAAGSVGASVREPYVRMNP